jgi:glycolate oxidase
MEEQIKQNLRDVVGEDKFTDELIDLVSYSYDASERRHRPFCAVWPQSEDQVARVLKIANDAHIPVIARGAGTGLAGAAVPVQGGIVLDLSQMNRIKEISIPDRLVVVEPGVVTAVLEEELAPHGYFFPPDPASMKASTLGGNAATNAGGLRGAKYGTTKDYVMGLRVALPDGSVMATGSRCMKTSSGYDLTKMFVGSEGTLGVITELTLKINPKPGNSSTCTAAFIDLEEAGNAVSEIMCSGIVPRALELLDSASIKAINQGTDLNLPEVEVMLLVETDGYTVEENTYQMERVMAALKAHNAQEITLAKSDAEAQGLWAGRRAAYAVMTRLATNVEVEDITVPVSRVAEMLKAVQDASQKYGTRVPTLGHLGDGNLHPLVVYNANDPDEVKRVEKTVEALFEKAVELGGTLSGEHGIGLTKAPYMHLEHDPKALQSMRALKNLFDPNNILNPGKMNLEAAG